MRTTIDIPKSQHQILHQLSQLRGYRGFSKIIQEALDYFFQNKVLDKKETHLLLKLKGSWKNSEAQEVRDNLHEVRSNWKKLS